MASGQEAPKLDYWASVWVFCTISGLVTLLPDGTIYGINHSFALTLFGYGRTELLGKVGSSGPWASHLLRRLGCVGGRPLCMGVVAPRFTQEGLRPQGSLADSHQAMSRGRLQSHPGGRGVLFPVRPGLADWARFRSRLQGRQTGQSLKI